MLWITIAGVLSFASVFVALEINNGVCIYRKYERAGDVKFLVVAGIRERDGQGACGKSSRSIFEQIVALDWIVSLLNGNGTREDSIIPGVSIGYDIYDNCDNEDLTTDLLYSGKFADREMDCNSSADDSVYISAISLTTPKATNTMARLLDPLPIFRPLVSSPTLESRARRNLIQSVPSFNQEATAIVKMLTRIGWNFIIVVHTEDATEEAKTFSIIANAHDICINATGAPDSNTVKKIFSTMNIAYNKSLAVVYFGSNSGAEFIVKESTNSRPYGSKIHWIFTSQFAFNHIIENQIKSSEDSATVIHLNNSANLNEYKTFFRNLSSNSQLKNLIQKYGFTLDNSALSSYPYPMVDAVLSAINSVKQLWDTTCGGHSTTVAECNSFKDGIKSELVNKIRSGVNIQDNISPKYLPSGYDRSLNYSQDGSQVYNALFLKMYTSEKDQTIGSFTNNEYTHAHNVHLLDSSACNTECPECLRQIDLRYSYLHGDYLILGLFSLRQYGGSPFSCGAIRRGTNDVITVSSFFHSVLERRTATGINFGAIAIDDCYNGLNTTNYLAKLFSKQAILKDPSDANRVINFDTVISLVGALSSSVSLIVADLSTSVGIPMISYSASSPDLDNKRRYPFFLRTVPSDTLQVQGMISMLESLAVTHVGLVYIDDAYGQGGKIQLLEEISNRNICVQNPISVRQNMPKDYIRDVINKLYNQQVRVVLLFIIDSVAQQILDVVNEFIQKFPPLVFISSEGWGSNLNLLTRTSLGSVVFNIAAQSYTTGSYRAYLKSLRPWQNQQNRWLPRYFEDYNRCDNLTSFEKTFIERNEAKICGDGYKSTLDTNTTESLAKDQRYFHTMLSVYAVTNGYQKFCHEETSCSPLAVRGRPSTFFTHIKSTKYGDNIPIFDEDGNGHIGFTIHNIQLNRTSGIYYYKRIGHYQKNGKLDLELEPKFYDDVQNEATLKDQYKTGLDCRYISACSEVCPLPDISKSTTEEPVIETTTSSDKNDSSLMTMTILFGVFMAILLVALVFVVVILIRILSRQTKQLSDKGDSAGHTVSMSDNCSVYDEPGSVRRKGQFDNIAFMVDSASLHSGQHTPSTMMRLNGSISSLNAQQPVQYAHIRQRSNPDISIHHVRQVSNQELRNQWFGSLERPMSTLSAPAYKPQSHQKSPFNKRNLHNTGARQKPYKQTYSPKTPHSAPTGFGQQRTPQVYRPRAQSSPRFRYPSSSGEESHYATPKIDSTEEIFPQRKMGVSDDNIHEHFDDNDSVSDGPNTCNVDSYLYPQSGSESGVQNQSEPEQKITYITAKDLITSGSDDEEACSSDSAIQYVLPESQHSSVPIKSNTFPKKPSTQSITSPTDNEVKEINFPPSDKTFRRIQSNDPLEGDKSLSQNAQNRTPLQNIQASTDSEQNHAVVYHKNTSRNSITDVPDVIKHGAYEEDGVFII